MTAPGVDGASGRSEVGWERTRFLGAPFDLLDSDRVLQHLCACRSGDPFRYIVTPNVDHVVRLSRDPSLAAAYDPAWMSWCDSSPIRLIAAAGGVALPHVTGADMVVRIFAEVLRPGDEVAAVVANRDLLDTLARAFPQFRWAGIDPPMGFDDDDLEIERVVHFVESHPARFVFLAVGAPRSERLAYRLHRRGRATGTALCIGASLEFLCGQKRRAPMWMRSLALEWLFRLASEPRRLWRRYVGAAPALLRLVAAELIVGAAVGQPRAGGVRAVRAAADNVALPHVAGPSKPAVDA